MRDLADGFLQHMYFWGRDVVQPEGNLLLSHGLSRRASTGLQGTSHYSMPWQGGKIELHGSYAGWFGNGQGFLFIRPLGRCVRWLDGCPPVPGKWPPHRFDTRPDDAMHTAAVPFLGWWLDYEAAVAERLGTAYRNDCFRKFKKLPKTRAWLPPATATRWISQLAENPASLARAKHFSPS